jgi:hypothetical protein
MSYKLNINQIDSELKNVFNTTNIDSSDYRQLNIRLSNPKLDSVNENLELQMFVSQSNLNQLNPILEWGYYTDSNNLDNFIKFKTPISNLGTLLTNIVSERRLDESYLDSIKPEEKINESLYEETTENIEHINETYELSENNLKIYGNKLKNFLYNQYGLTIDDLEISHYDMTSGRKRSQGHMLLSDGPKMGDECVLELRNISSTSNVIPRTWISVENQLRKLPHVEDVNSNTHNYSMNVTFSTKVFVEIQ